MLPLWYSIFGWLLSVLTVAGNGIVIYLIVTRQRLHTTVNWFVLSLATADFCVGASYFLTEYLCDLVSCNYRLRYAIGSFLSAASATNLCLLTLDRYIAIVKPLKYGTFMTTRRVVLVISAAWLSSFLTHFIYFVICVVLTRDRDYLSRKFIVFDFVIFEIFPLVILSLATGRIFLIARRHSRQSAVVMAQLRFNQRIEDGKDRSVQSRERSSAKLVGVATSVFFVCYVNEIFYTVYNQLPEKRHQNAPFLYTTWLLNITNSAVNPVAYAFFKSDIKESLRSMFRCSREAREHLRLTFSLKSNAVAQR